MDVPLDEPDHDDQAVEPEPLTVLDQYYLAYERYVDRHDREPKGAAAFEELSQSLAQDGVLGTRGQPVSPSTLRRYALEQRIYRRWAEERERLGEGPDTDALLEHLVQDGVTAANRTPTVDDVQRAEHLASGFERRYQTLRNYRRTAQS